MLYWSSFHSLSIFRGKSTYAIHHLSGCIVYLFNYFRACRCVNLHILTPRLESILSADNSTSFISADKSLKPFPIDKRRVNLPDQTARVCRLIWGYPSDVIKQAVTVFKIYLYKISILSQTVNIHSEY